MFAAIRAYSATDEQCPGYIEVYDSFCSEVIQRGAVVSNPINHEADFQVATGPFWSVASSVPQIRFFASGPCTIYAANSYFTGRWVA